MTNVYATSEKLTMKNYLFQTAVSALEQDGWKVERVPRSGKSSVRRISRGGLSKIAAIRTSQNTWIAFPHLADGSWRTLDEVDVVVAVSVDDEFAPKFVRVHIIDGDDARSRFQRAFEARRKAGYQLQSGRGIWISLYDKDGPNPVTHVGAGAGLENAAIASVPIDPSVEAPRDEDTDDDVEAVEEPGVHEDRPLSIGEAKRRLALSLGVPESAITITVSA